MLGASLLVLTSISASASQGQTLVSAATCVPQLPTTSALYIDGILYNISSTSSMGVECPYVKTNINAVPLEAYVEVINGAAGTSAMTCTLEAHASNATTYNYVSASTNTWQTTPQLLTFNNVPVAPDGGGSIDDSYYEVKCFLPAYTSRMSGVMRTHLNETPPSP
jgi:hypothetical protein